ncbi:GAF domain-containing sensor histidine kinase [Devosia elaeis]|jgi:Signal transduction histidine kinase|uniref:ATPase n=1 Tax=Devosia elaeis TaxID=1770058 RepID=A0A178I3H4_9HYPH|nr:GAF domain-containing protein [Devosia elaeis]OAM79676.1 ATPase [Devosia elaeis]
MHYSQRAMESLIGVSHALAGHTDPGEAFRATAEEIRQLISYDHIDIALMLPDNMHVVHEVGPRTSWSNLAKHPLPTDCSPARLVMQRQQPFLLAVDALLDERFHFLGALDEPIYAAQLRSRIIVPMRIRGDIIGSLNISRQVPGCYTLDDVEIAQVCADFLTPYISALLHAQEARRAMLAERKARRRELQLRRGASQLTETMDKESRRLAMDLHDQTLADLARIARYVSSMRCENRADPAALGELEQLVGGCLTELRQIIDDMQPNMLRLFGLADALDAHLFRSVRYATPPVSISVTDRTAGLIDTIDDRLRTALYRIAQEAINNAARHADATNVTVLIDQKQGGFRVSVSDNGKGIGLRRKQRIGGLSHMQTRATLIGASLSFEAGLDGRGTQVVVEIDASLEGGDHQIRARELN